MYPLGWGGGGGGCTDGKDLFCFITLKVSAHITFSSLNYGRQTKTRGYYFVTCWGFIFGKTLILFVEELC